MKNVSAFFAFLTVCQEPVRNVFLSGTNDNGEH